MMNGSLTLHTRTQPTRSKGQRHRLARRRQAACHPQQRYRRSREPGRRWRYSFPNRRSRREFGIWYRRRFFSVWTAGVCVGRCCKLCQDSRQHLRRGSGMTSLWTFFTSHMLILSLGDFADQLICRVRGSLRHSGITSPMAG
jgi:hypothetical protein